MANPKETKKMLDWMRRGGRLWLIVACAAAGLILLVAGIVLDDRQTAKTGGSTEGDWQTYTAALEAKAADLCTRVAGVSDVTVAVSLAQGVEYVYAGEDGSARQALLVTERPPQISGIGVVCAGADDPATVQTLLSLLSAAFGVSTNRIYITAAG